MEVLVDRNCVNETLEIAVRAREDLNTAAQLDTAEQELPDSSGGSCPECVDSIRDSSAALDVKGDL